MIIPYPFTLLLLLVLILPFLHADKPDQVIELFRHGARSPIFPYDQSWNPSEQGQLTTVGMLQHYNLGKKLADKYAHLVESGYNPDDVYILSNLYSRCVESAMAQVASLFRGKNSTLVTEHPQKDLQDRIIERITPLLSVNEAERGEFVPVKIDIVKGTKEEVVFNGRNKKWCKQIGDYMNENLLSAEMAQGWSVFQDPIQKANALLPPHQQISDMMTLNIAYDAFIADLYENKTLPGGIDDRKLLESLNYAQAYYQEILEHRGLIQKGLASYPTLKAIADQLKNFRQGKSPKKLALLSGHDMNLYAVLSAFEIISPNCLLTNYEDLTQDRPRSYPDCRYPEFASNLIFEFYNDTTDPYVKFYYDDVLIPLCNGQETCTYDEFLSFLQNAGGNNTIGTWNERCKSQKHHKQPKDKNLTSTNSTQNDTNLNSTNKTETPHKKNKHKKDPSPLNQTQNDTNLNRPHKTETPHKKNKHKKDPSPLNQTQNHPHNKTKETVKNDTSRNQPQRNHTKPSKTNRTNTTSTQDKSHQETKGSPQEFKGDNVKGIHKIESKAANKWLLVGPIIVIVLVLAFFLRAFIKRTWHSIKITQKGYEVGPDQEESSLSA